MIAEQLVSANEKPGMVYYALDVETATYVLLITFLELLINKEL